MNSKTLGSLERYERAVVVGFYNNFCCPKLVDMGMLPGAIITLLNISPLGGAVEICLRGHYLTIRKSNADKIFVSKVA